MTSDRPCADRPVAGAVTGAPIGLFAGWTAPKASR